MSFSGDASGMKVWIRMLFGFWLTLSLGIMSLWAQGNVETLKKGVVKITAQFSNTQKVGTGFIIGQGKKHLFIVTASHVIESETELPRSIHVTFFMHQEEPFVADVIKKEGGDPED